MRITALTLFAAFGLATSVVSANAAPTAPVPTTPQASNIVQVAGGCGPGLHRYRGHCVRNHHYRPYAYSRHRYYRGEYARSYGSEPGDHVANQLNGQELGRGY